MHRTESKSVGQEMTHNRFQKANQAATHKAGLQTLRSNRIQSIRKEWKDQGLLKTIAFGDFKGTIGTL